MAGVLIRIVLGTSRQHPGPESAYYFGIRRCAEVPRLQGSGPPPCFPVFLNTLQSSKQLVSAAVSLESSSLVHRSEQSRDRFGATSRHEIASGPRYRSLDTVPSHYSLVDPSSFSKTRAHEASTPQHHEYGTSAASRLNNASLSLHLPNRLEADHNIWHVSAAKALIPHLEESCHVFCRALVPARARQQENCGVS